MISGLGAYYIAAKRKKQQQQLLITKECGQYLYALENMTTTTMKSLYMECFVGGTELRILWEHQSILRICVARHKLLPEPNIRCTTYVYIIFQSQCDSHSTF